MIREHHRELSLTIDDVDPISHDAIELHRPRRVHCSDEEQGSAKHRDTERIAPQKLNLATKSARTH